MHARSYLIQLLHYFAQLLAMESRDVVVQWKWMSWQEVKEKFGEEHAEKVVEHAEQRVNADSGRTEFKICMVA